MSTLLQRAIHRQETLLYRFIQPVCRLLQFRQFFLQREQVLVLVAVRLPDLGFQVFQHRFQAIRMRDLIRQRLQHQVIELMHRHCWRIALVDMLAQAGIALVVAVTTALPGCQSHPRATFAAFEQTRQQGRRIQEAWRRDFRRTSMALGFDHFERRFIDNGRDRHDDPFRLRFDLSGAHIGFVEDVAPVIGGIAQQLMHPAL
ncbi:MAG TPA: hypothetical protein VJ577_02665 [Burkholderiaceae bacterium]|nr:hypothetical protein [Burkholderiaceae bacterium]